MKAASILILFFAPVFLPAQETAWERNPWKAVPPLLPDAVINARVTAETVLKGGGEEGGDFIIQRIERPVFTHKPTVPAPLVVPRTKGELAARTARRALEPNELLLFSPTVVIYENGISQVRWGSVDRLKGYQQYAAFVRLDLQAIDACPDLIVGRRCYCLMPMMFHATDRMVWEWKAPAISSFKEPTDIVLVEGDPGNKNSAGAALGAVILL